MIASTSWRHACVAPLLALLCVLAGCTRTSLRQPPAYSPLILISIDGYRADYIERGLSPNLAMLAHGGVRATAMKPAFPTLTFPNHYTIVTGLYPEHNGIVNNHFLDPVTGAKFVYNKRQSTDDPHWWGGEPLWVGVERQGKHAATMFWPGSDVAIDGVRPEHWLPFNGEMSPDARVDQALQWFDLPAGQRPDFMTLYFEQVDHAGHGHGPNSPEVDTALGEVDAAIGRLIDGLKQRGIFTSANIVIVSDHGMTKAAPDKRSYLDDSIPLADVNVVNYGVVAGIAPHAGKTAEVERALLAPHPHMQCMRKSELPARWHYGASARIPPLLCVAEDGGIVTSHDYENKKGHFSVGEHGYDNDDPNMRALFVAEGPAFKRGFVQPEFDNVDVYPLLMKVLGLRPAPNDGDLGAVRDMLAGSR